MSNEKNVSLPYSPHEFPQIRIRTAAENKCLRDICFIVGGGLGDRACAEPTLRFALKNMSRFADSFSLVCETPELFRHLDFKEVFDLKKTYPIMGRHLYLNTYPASPLYNEFVNANMVNGVDYASLSALRMQLPIEYKDIRLSVNPPSRKRTDLYDVLSSDHVLVHPGLGWVSKTLPVEFWNEVISKLHKRGCRPVLIGNKTVDGPLDPDNLAVNLRNKTTVEELVWLCKNLDLITNDSSPLHLAASGDKKIAFISTAKRGDLLYHHRVDGFGHRMHDFAKKEMWSMFDWAPNSLDDGRSSDVPRGTSIEDFFPIVDEMVDWITFGKDW